MVFLCFVQSYGIDHLLTFANLRQLGLLVEQQPGETLTVMESKVGKIINDKTVGENFITGPLSLCLYHFRSLLSQTVIHIHMLNDYIKILPFISIYIYLCDV